MEPKKEYKLKFDYNQKPDVLGNTLKALVYGTALLCTAYGIHEMCKYTQEDNLKSKLEQKSKIIQAQGADVINQLQNSVSSYDNLESKTTNSKENSIKKIEVKK